MSLRLRTASIIVSTILCLLNFDGIARAASVVDVYRFIDTGSSTPSNYAKGNAPYAELLQASDGNFYGTAFYGGSGLCPHVGFGGYTGCGTIFKITPQGVKTVLYSFPFDTATNLAPDGAFPTAGLIQGKDGYLYGVAQDGGLSGQCNGMYGCGTMFRISTVGKFTLLHQFCGTSGCQGIVEGGRPMNHLVQAANGLLYGTANEGGTDNDGTVFSATTSGAVKTLHYFLYGAGDGDSPFAALLVGHDGSTVYGTTQFGGAKNGGIVFSYGTAGLRILHSFDNVVASDPAGALIYGADGLLYGTTYGGNVGGTLYSLNTSGGAFGVDAQFPSGAPAAGLLLGSNGLMYGTLLSGDVSLDGSVFDYNPKNKVMNAVVGFMTSTGAAPRSALIEGTNKDLFGTNSLYGGANNLGQDGGTIYVIGPALNP